ncbi:carcinine hydrolase/isopenicillin-N N-acyltransferase family protein [Paenibacillus sp. MER 99-2]|uniref:carcinine hydrolase/isopenicillin-N N-acyltransferase family protein n=1 Tax=Paenibacillus sp. MER 99-2 TaxID=2939572 RepID=UPI00203D237A|nr:carcinine hydrolase/isopenicillin-N N-acyltransferase family protein [Paenibacillus sp. MER 99-2]MCM3173732.1 carcinine hydrolase/isopenicillin-N N-acyltransferase family protein [Paenibacillus sp. MER 99-2]
MSTAFTLQLQGTTWVCKNQDVIYDGVYLFTNQRGLSKTALMPPPSIPATWISVYGSLTISQVGKENPNGGINEAGLVVEQTTLWSSEYPTVDERPAISELQWIQYLLDTSRTVQEALKCVENIRIAQATSQLHYLIADRSGDYAIVEFISGQMFVHRRPLPFAVITNTAYVDAIHDLKAGQSEWASMTDYERNSMERLQTVTDALASTSLMLNAGNVMNLFDLLGSSSRPDTVYSLVYDLEHSEIYITTKNHANCIGKIRLKDFNFDKSSPAQVLDVQTGWGAHRALVFQDYSAELNMAAVRSFFRDPVLTSVFQWEISEELIHHIAHYPDSCI